MWRYINTDDTLCHRQFKYIDRHKSNKTGKWVYVYKDSNGKRVYNKNNVASNYYNNRVEKHPVLTWLTGNTSKNVNQVNYETYEKDLQKTIEDANLCEEQIKDAKAFMNKYGVSEAMQEIVKKQEQRLSELETKINDYSEKLNNESNKYPTKSIRARY